MSSVKRSRILVAMSGGVDSSVAAALLHEAGHEVVGVTMKTFCYEETPAHSKTCCGLDGILDARSVADRLGIPHYVFDVEEDFTRDVIDDFVSEYARGRTPNPCVRCNSNTKFRDLMRRGVALGCDGIATGHYVRALRPESGTSGVEVELHRGADAGKDQAYFLWGLPHDLVTRLHFPLGDLTKPQVRQMARERGFLTAEKPESQEICFVPAGDYRDFLRTRLPTRHPSLEPGPIVTLEGAVVGYHQGYAGYTVGQRRGLGGGFAEPMYVVEVRPETGEVVVGPEEALYAAGMEIEDLNWITDTPPTPGDELQVQIRHRAPPLPVTLEDGPHGLRLRFPTPQRSVTPGQSAALFRGTRLLGGGRISLALVPAPV